MLQRLCPLCLADEAAGAPSNSLSVFSYNSGVTDRAAFRQTYRLGAVRSLARNDRGHFRNDIPRSPHDDGVADAHILSVQFIDVVQRRIADGDASNEYRLETCDGCQGAGAADLELNRLDDRQLFLRRKLVRDRPTRRPRHETQLALQREVVDFVHDSVDVVAQRVPSIADVLIKVQATLDATHPFSLRADLEAPVLQLQQHLAVRLGHLAVFDKSRRVHINIQRPGRCQFRVELAQTSGRSVTWIDEGLLPAFPRRRVVGLESGARHEYLTANLEYVGKIIPSNSQWNRLDRPRVMRDVLTGSPVTACRGDLEHAIDVHEADRSAIELWFRGVFDLAVGQVEPLSDTLVEVAEFLFGKRVVQRQHRQPVCHRAEAGDGFVANSLGRRIGSDEFGVISFQALQFAHQAVVLDVGNLRIIEHMIEIAVMTQLLP